MTEKRNRGGARRDNSDQDETETLPAADDGSADSARPVASPASRRRGLGMVVLLLLIVALAVVAYRYWGFWQAEPTTAAAPPPPAVTVAKPVVREMRQWTDFTGQFEARESVEIRARVSGYLESVNF